MRCSIHYLTVRRIEVAKEIGEEVYVCYYGSIFNLWWWCVSLWTESCGWFLIYCPKAFSSSFFPFLASSSPPFPSPAAHVKNEWKSMQQEKQRKGGAKRKTTLELLEDCWGQQCHASLDHNKSTSSDEGGNKFICSHYMVLRFILYICNAGIIFSNLLKICPNLGLPR